MLKTTESIYGKKLELFISSLHVCFWESIFVHWLFFFFPFECTAERVVDVTVVHCLDPRWKNSVVTSEEGAGFLEGGVLFMQ